MMNVHIVASRLDSDRVLPRLARALACGTGWSLSEMPDPKADMNYFFPYLEVPKAGWDETPSAAWFTHKDEGNPSKAAVWDRAAKSVDLRTLTASPYYDDLAQYGPVRVVRPAVDVHFTPGTPGPARARGRVVGLNGYSYRDNRKGEDLVARLATSDLGKTIKWKASGRDWPVHTRSYTWDEMPGFFRSLDVFLCASRVEGVPMPPLEALRCGVPVVIPRCVGMLDDLPDLPGIWRFEPGDYEDLERALRQALEDRREVDVQMLYEAAGAYSRYNWCVDHELAFEELLHPRRPAEALPDWRGRAAGPSTKSRAGLPPTKIGGMYCVAFGEPSRRCAERLIRSFKAHMPGLPVALAAAEPLGAGEDAFIPQKDRDIGGRLAKLSVDRLAPAEWKYVLYMDADTEVMEPVDFIFDTLQAGWEFVICKDMHERHWLAKMDRGDNHTEFVHTVDVVGTDQAMQYNGGLFAYVRNRTTRQFFEAWNLEYEKYLGRDQGALIRALHRNPMRLFVLMNQWNASDRYELPPGPLAVVHHNVEARRWARPILGRIDSEDAWRAVEEWEAAHA